MRITATKHTLYFSNPDEVEYVFGVTLNEEQRIMIHWYIISGNRPDPKGCWTCSPAAMRILTSDMDLYETAVKEGREVWPWETKERTP